MQRVVQSQTMSLASVGSRLVNMHGIIYIDKTIRERKQLVWLLFFYLGALGQGSSATSRRRSRAPVASYCLTAQFLTDSQILASAANSDRNATEGPWQIRATLSQVRASSRFHPSRLSYVSRAHNVKAHHHSRLALRITTCSVKCLNSGSGQCHVCDVLTPLSVLPLRLMLVKCA